MKRNAKTILAVLLVAVTLLGISAPGVRCDRRVYYVGRCQDMCRRQERLTSAKPAAS